MPDRHTPNPRASIGAAIVVALLLAAGVYVFWRLDQSQRAQACLESGGRKCAIIDSPPAR